jgi:hypothetical protein
MGHIKLAGHVTEETHFGVALGRIDIPSKDGGMFTQYFSGGSIYRLTPTTEETARAYQLGREPAPIQRWELLPEPQETAPASDDDDDW